MLPIDCHDYGLDFIAGAGHKWLCGGPGTGIFYVRTSGDNLPPFYGQLVPLRLCLVRPGSEYSL